MQIVIDIPENIYNLIARGEENRDFVYKSDLMRTILEGIPLPKGHGRLIDERQVIMALIHHDFLKDNVKCGDITKILDMATIIEAEEEKK